MGATGSFLASLCVSLFWGVTNIFIKQTTSEITKVTGKTWHERFINEIVYLLSNWSYLLAFGINQIGSVLFYITLLYSDLSLVVPVTNSLTFVTTAVTGLVFGEKVPESRTVVGSILVVFGTGCCVWDKISFEDQK